MMATIDGGRVSNIEYTTHDVGTDSGDSIRVDIKNNDEVYVPNSGWSLSNPALCVLAFLDVRPSTLSTAENRFLPFIVDRDGNNVVPPFVISQGQKKLLGAEWFEPRGAET